MAKKSILQLAKRINKITRALRAETDNLDVNVAIRVLPSQEQIEELHQSIRSLKKAAGRMKELQEASTLLAAARESVPADRRRRVKKVYRANPDTISLNAEKVEQELGLPGAARRLKRLSHAKAGFDGIPFSVLAGPWSGKGGRHGKVSER